MRMQHFLKPDVFVFIKARVEPRLDFPGQISLRVSSVTLLQEVFEKFTKSITVTLSLDDLTKENISFLSFSCKAA